MNGESSNFHSAWYSQKGNAGLTADANTFSKDINFQDRGFALGICFLGDSVKAGFIRSFVVDQEIGLNKIPMDWQLIPVVAA